MPDKVCSACHVTLDSKDGGIEAFGSWFCSACFIGNSMKLNKSMTPEAVAVLRRRGTELAGLLPGELLEMILMGFYKRASGMEERPDEVELSRAVGEIQRLTAFCVFRNVLNLLKTWHGMFSEFVEGQETEIRDKIKRLTDLE
jgi:hypothetical protein